jgi:hypothetical protein
VEFPSGNKPLYLTDLQTRAETTFSARGGAAPGNDGTLLLYTANGLALARNGQISGLGIASNLGVIDPAAATIVYSPYSSPQWYVYSIANRTSTLLAEHGGYPVFLSDDGSMVVYSDFTSPDVPQIFTVNTDGTGRRRITDFPRGAYPLAMSGDRKVVFARPGNFTAGDNPIVRIDLATGRSSEIVPSMPTPFFSRILFTAAPGSLAQFGWLFAFGKNGAQSEQPYPMSLAGVTVRINGSPAPIQSVSENRVVFQLRYGSRRSVSCHQLLYRWRDHCAQSARLLYPARLLDPIGHLRTRDHRRRA